MSNIVRVEGLYAADEDEPRGRARGRLRGLFWSIGAGAHAVLGRPEDGTIALAEMLVGRRKPRAGRVRVDGRYPAGSPGVRRRIGSLLASAALSGGRVRDAVRLARRPHGGDDPLARFGLSKLAPRPLSSLLPEEARAVELAIALSLADPLLLVLYEPFERLAGIDGGAVRETLAALAARAAVVLLCSAPADATSAGDRVYLLDAGSWVAADVATGWPARALAELVVWLDDADGRAALALANALGQAPSVTAIAWRRGEDGSPVSALTLRASDLDEAARALCEAAAALHSPIRALHAPPLDRGGLLHAARARMHAPSLGSGGAP